jgi:hypothetical protein
MHVSTPPNVRAMNDTRSQRSPSRKLLFSSSAGLQISEKYDTMRCERGRTGHTPHANCNRSYVWSLGSCSLRPRLDWRVNLATLSEAEKSFLAHFFLYVHVWLKATSRFATNEALGVDHANASTSTEYPSRFPPLAPGTHVNYNIWNWMQLRCANHL